jgi:hypothetical protein
MRHDIKETPMAMKREDDVPQPVIEEFNGRREGLRYAQMEPLTAEARLKKQGGLPKRKTA